ncbi:hypothetical protein GGR56DRAFT_677910 [Xylariaceae sp. FL0804]|nr:hypothetical protein GGR56DRAFT_677910 [Xylariaceae sp. FL0804]
MIYIRSETKQQQQQQHMESFALAAQHSGAVSHVHTVTLRIDGSAVAVARELRLAVTVAVVGWVAVAGIRALLLRAAAPPPSRP